MTNSNSDNAAESPYVFEIGDIVKHEWDEDGKMYLAKVSIGAAGNVGGTFIECAQWYQLPCFVCALAQMSSRSLT